MLSAFLKMHNQEACSSLLNGIQEVVGSIFFNSTTCLKGLEGVPSKPFFVEGTKY